jgi:diguanylate cyclase (GGDEF)-like protein
VNNLKINLSSNKNKLVALLILVSAIGFLTTSFLSYFSSVNAMKKSIIESELPLTSDNIFSAVRRDIIEPTLVSSMIANDTFLHDWVDSGEKNMADVTRYLSQIKDRYKATTSFFVSDRSHHYYYADGLLKTIMESDPHDSWYFNLRKSDKLYVTEVDTDQAHQNQLTIFINYKVFDKDKSYLGVGGLGLTVHGVSKLIDEYQQKFQRNIYFTDANGNVVLAGPKAAVGVSNINQVEGLKDIATQVLSNKKEFFEYDNQGRSVLLNVRYLPELGWYVFVEKNVDKATSAIRKALYLNLTICAFSILLISWLMRKMVNNYHEEVEKLAISDSLTGLPNRTYLELMAQGAMKESKRKSEALSMLLIDADYFKQVNDKYGHLAGDEVLRKLAFTMKGCLREADYICRWGGEEFLVLLKNCNAKQAQQIAEKMRLEVERLQVDTSSESVSVTISLGVADWVFEESFEQWLGRADAALRQAKQLGRNRVQIA